MTLLRVLLGAILLAFLLPCPISGQNAPPGDQAVPSAVSLEGGINR
ncbi:MAG: hypothetical protein LAP40_01375 [Acidobacteriia bacterium]|nr:hypothetical protein [Terriglobia bacterium]